MQAIIQCLARLEHVVCVCGGVIVTSTHVVVGVVEVKESYADERGVAF